jgi:hypothetical protein
MMNLVFLKSLCNALVGHRVMCELRCQIFIQFWTARRPQAANRVIPSKCVASFWPQQVLKTPFHTLHDLVGRDVWRRAQQELADVRGLEFVL